MGTDVKEEEKKPAPKVIRVSESELEEDQRAWRVQEEEEESGDAGRRGEWMKKSGPERGAGMKTVA